MQYSSILNKIIIYLAITATVLCIPVDSNAQYFRRKGNIIYANGNKILVGMGTDTLIITDPVTGEERTLVSGRDNEPIKLNGARIYDHIDTPPVFNGGDEQLANYMLNRLQPMVQYLDDGVYRLDVYDVLIDTHGKVVYHNINSDVLKKQDPGLSNLWRTVNVNDKVADAIIEMMNDMPVFSPGKLSGKAVPYNMRKFMAQHWLAVKDHKMSMIK